MKGMDLTIDSRSRRGFPDGNVTEKDKFKLAKTTLLVGLIVYVGIALLYAFGEQLSIAGPIKNVWLFSSQGLFGIINLLIGFYFGNKAAKES